MTALTSDKVLAVPSQSVHALFAEPKFYDGPGRISETMEAIRRDGRIVTRASAESTESLKQIIAYGIVRTGRRILCLRRSSKANRPALRLRYTVLFGGHVDEADLSYPDPMKHCVEREVTEELGLHVNGDVRLLGVVADPSTPVGRLHLGV